MTELSPDDPYLRPEGVGDGTVAATGKLTEALEWLQRARGHLYDVHQMIGHADALMGEAADLLDDAGHAEEAELVRTEVVGRNVLEGRWTFQIVDEAERRYFTPVNEVERTVRERLLGGRSHVHEAEMKAARVTPGHPEHRLRPRPAADEDAT